MKTIKAWAVIINNSIWKSKNIARIYKTRKEIKSEYPEYKPIRIEIKEVK